MHRRELLAKAGALGAAALVGNAASASGHVSIIAKVTGRTVGYAHSSVEEARQRLLAHWDPDFVDGTLAAWAYCLEHPEPVTATVLEVAMNPPQPFEEWVEAHRTLFT